MQPSVDLFGNLPPEITLEILSLLPIRSAIKCKVVCRSWRDVVESRQFLKSHFAKHHPHLFVSLGSCYKILEFVRENEPPNRAVDLRLPRYEHAHSSVDGLILLCSRGTTPVTRDYVRLPYAPRQYVKGNVGFGVSRSGQYKVVRITFRDKACYVYTLGTGRWRAVADGPPPTFGYNRETVSVSVGGSLYWLVYGSESWRLRISRFDLETEEFSSFPAPPRLYAPKQYYYGSLCIIGESVLCENSMGVETVIWLMREQGCWTKELVIKGLPYVYGSLIPIKVFEDGNILLGARKRNLAFYYSENTRTVKSTSPWSHPQKPPMQSFIPRAFFRSRP